MRFFCLFWLLPYILVAQPFHQSAKGWQEVTISDGLSQGMIFDLKQDQKGFVWIATKDGLNRYDGHNFRIFTHDPYQAFSISGNSCSALLIDRQQRIWVGTLNKGLNLFDPNTERFYHLNLTNKASGQAGRYEISQLTEDPDGNIWVATYNHLLLKITLSAALKLGYPNQADFTKQVKVTILTIPVQESTQVRSLVFRPDGQLLAWSGKGVYSINWQRPTDWRQLPILDRPDASLKAVYTDSLQRYWFAATADRFLAWHQGQWRSMGISASKSAIVQIWALRLGKIAILTQNYLWLMSPEELFRQDSLSARNAYVAMPNQQIGAWVLMQDKTGNLWFGTPGYGLRKFNPRVRDFHSYLPDHSLSHLLADQQGRIYLQQYSGYELFDRLNQQLRPLPASLPKTSYSKSFILQDRRGFFWAYNTEVAPNDVSGERRLLQFSADWKLLHSYPIPAGVRFGLYGNQALEDTLGHLWLGAVNGKLLRFSPQTGQFRVFDYSRLLPPTGADTEVFALLLEPEGTGTLWIGTPEGLVRATSLTTQPTFTLFQNSTQDRQSLSENFVLSLCPDPQQPDRYLWVGTKGGGLDRLDKQTTKFQHVTEKEGLPNKVVYGLLPDEFGNLWMSTNRGIAQFNPRTGKFRTYTRADGLQDDEFNNQAYTKTPSGELLFGGVNGLTSFRPADIIGRNRTKPQVAIIGLRINNKPVEVGNDEGILTQSLHETTELNLSHDQNLVTLEFGVMDYTNVGKNQFRYRLEGIDRDWVEAGKNRFANYAQLPDGRYTLQVQGSADGEAWSDSVSLTIRVRPPFYRTWWAYLVYVLVLGGLAWQFYRSQTQRLLLQQQVAFEQKEAGRLAELDTLKTQFFTNISHEIRTPLTLMLGPLADLKRRFPSEWLLDTMERNGQRLLTLINQLLDLSKLEAGQLKSETEPGDLAVFFRTLASSFTSLAESRGIPFSVEQTETSVWARFDRDKLEKIVTNLLANAFKFTPTGRAVRMQVRYEGALANRQVLFVVDDEGIGIAADKLPRIFDRFYQTDSRLNRAYEGTGIGLALVHELVQVLGGTIDVQSTEGIGTQFMVTLPLELAEKLSVENLPEASAEPQRDELTLLAPLSENRLAGQQPQLTSLDFPVLLLIDDNADIRAYVRSIFQTDYQIMEAEDGQQGLELATEHAPDLVICDLMMPRLDGFGFCRALKTQDATSHIPVVMLTAKATIKDRIEGFGLGADEYLTKPFNADEMRVRVRNLLDKQQRLQAYFRGQLTQPGPLPVAADSLGAPNLADLFIQKCYTLLETHLDNPEFDVEMLATQLAMSRRNLNRKLMALTSLPAGNFIRSYRLKKAAELLRSGLSPTETAYRVGFESPSAFSRSFKDQFGQTPSAFVSQG